MKHIDIPDRVSANPDSDYFFEAGIWLGVTLNGADVTNVTEFCQSGGWLTRIDEKTFSMGLKTIETLRGEVKAYVKAQ